jgi:hypothetical protein
MEHRKYAVTVLMPHVVPLFMVLLVVSDGGVPTSAIPSPVVILRRTYTPERKELISSGPRQDTVRDYDPSSLVDEAGSDACL